MADPLTNALLGYGPVGLILAILVYVIKALWTQYTATQEARIKERGESIAAMNGMATALDKLALTVQNGFSNQQRFQPPQSYGPSSGRGD